MMGLLQSVQSPEENTGILQKEELCLQTPSDSGRNISSSLGLQTLAHTALTSTQANSLHSVSPPGVPLWRAHYYHNH